MGLHVFSCGTAELRKDAGGGGAAPPIALPPPCAMDSKLCRRRRLANSHRRGRRLGGLPPQRGGIRANSHRAGCRWFGGVLLVRFTPPHPDCPAPDREPDRTGSDEWGATPPATLRRPPAAGRSFSRRTAPTSCAVDDGGARIAPRYKKTRPRYRVAVAYAARPIASDGLHHDIDPIARPL